MMANLNALALFGVIGVGMTTSATLLVRTVLTAMRQPRVQREPVACSCC